MNKKYIWLVVCMQFLLMPFAQSKGDSRAKLEVGEYFMNGQAGRRNCSIRIFYRDNKLHMWVGSDSTSNGNCRFTNEVVSYIYNSRTGIYKGLVSNIEVINPWTFRYTRFPDEPREWGITSEYIYEKIFN